MSESIPALFRTIRDCRQCYADRCGIKVGVPEEIPDNIRVVVIGEQPPRSTSDDRAAADPDTEYMPRYLDRAGVDPSTVLYVTAVMCHPEDPSLRPTRPSATEVRNCSTYLRKLLERARPRLIVPLGHTGLLALQFALKDWTELRQFILNYDIGGTLTRADCTVYPLVLPSRATLRMRPEERQVRDWQRVAQLLESTDKRVARTG